jgi:4-carboxymuconolactone decarboxylase
MTQRVRDLPLEEMSVEQRGFAAALESSIGGVHGPYLAWIERPELGARIHHLLDYIRFESPLPRRLRMIATLVSVKHWGAAYAWGVQAPIALASGLPRGIVEAIAAGRSPEFDDADDEAAYAVCSELLARRALSDETYRGALERLGQEHLTELVATVGHFCIVSLTLLAFDIQPRHVASPPLSPTPI